MQLSGHVRSGVELWIGEVAAAAGLIAVILALARTAGASLSAGAVGVVDRGGVLVHLVDLVRHPAVTVARTFSDTFAGISPASVPPFVVFQIVGAALGPGLVVALYPDAPQAAGAVVVPHERPVPATQRNTPGPPAPLMQLDSGSA